MRVACRLERTLKLKMDLILRQTHRDIVPHEKHHPASKILKTTTRAGPQIQRIRFEKRRCGKGINIRNIRKMPLTKNKTDRHLYGMYAERYLLAD